MTDDEADALLDDLHGVSPRKRLLSRIALLAVLPLLPFWIPGLYIVTHAAALKEWITDTYHYHDAYFRHVWHTGRWK